MSLIQQILWLVVGILLWIFVGIFIYVALKNRRMYDDASRALVAWFWPVTIPLLIISWILDRTAGPIISVIKNLFVTPATYLANVIFPPRKRGRPKGNKNKPKG